MGDYPFLHVERVRFRDLDAMGHLNNAVFATYVEQARIEYLRQTGVISGPFYDGRMSMILARLEIDFLAPGEPEGEVEIGVRPARLGTKSFELEYELRQAGRVIAGARSVLVAYDYDRGESMAVPDGWRDALQVAA
ncbi:MAG: acyl-CoA thioesterase [Gaiellaceae bacterium]